MSEPQAVHTGADCDPWHARARRHLRHSLKWRVLLMFLLLAMTVVGVVVFGAQRAFSLGWRDAAQPVLADYLQRLTADVTAGGATPDVARAQALVARLPLTVHIEGPTVQWDSHPRAAYDMEGHGSLAQTLQTRTADGHVLRFGINFGAVERRPRFFGLALAALVGSTVLAWLFLRRLLRPLDAIGAGAQRFGRGDFSQPIALRHARSPDELDQLADTINTMGRDIHQMLEAKRGLLLAISHELRSPLTRARLNTELLPETAEVQPSREALLRDLALMRDLVSDLLESERLSSRHAALHTEETDLATLIAEVVSSLPAGAVARQDVSTPLPHLMLDPARMRLLLRNLLDNALRFTPPGAPVPLISAQPSANGGIQLTVRDFGPGVSEDQLSRLGQPFYRPDTARTREGGGVGLGLYLCRLVALAHGGAFTVRNAAPGLQVQVDLIGPHTPLR